MINIWGLSKIKKESEGAKTTDEIKKIIEDEIAETLNLSSVDPNEIVIFGDKQGKMKTSNVSLDDILTRVRGAADNTIALFQDGKLKPGALINTITDKFTKYDKEVADHTDKLTEYDKELAKHITNYNNFRTNIIYKFFGKQPTVTPSLAEIKTGLDKLNEITQQLVTVNTVITAINSRLGVVREERSISDSIAFIKRSVDNITTDVTVIKEDLIKIIPRAEKVKIPHEEEDIKNNVYTIQQDSFVWDSITSNILRIRANVKGIYRLTLVSPIQFNISTGSSSGVNNVISTIIEAYADEPFTITSTDANLTKATMTWYLEFVAKLK
jgi:hypothetical protein